MSSAVRRKSQHITNVLNTALHKFYILGDMNHNPMSFHISDIKMHLRGFDCEIALQEACKFLYGEKKTWVFAVYHFFKVDGELVVIPSEMKIEDTDLREVADSAQEYIADLKASVIDSDDGLTEENYIFYGYYINYGTDLRMDLMEDDIIAAYLKVNNDLVDVKDEIVECTAELK
ncbi:hypothetical protein EGM85_11255, partial [Macrococcus caseolyticus]